jgi:hypothetical protein
LRTFGKEKEDKVTETNLNDLLGIDDWTMAVSEFPDPFITCCFTSSSVLFINLFYSYSCKHYHFYYDLKKQ